MKKISILLSFLVLLNNHVYAQLPDLTVEEIADLIQLQENKIKSFNIKYRLEQTKIEKQQSQVEGNVPDIIVDLEYAQDIIKGYSYFHEKWVNHSSGEDFERKYAYDGKNGTELHLKTPGDQESMYGTVSSNMPETLQQQLFWKPEWSAYGLIPGSMSLSSAIKDATKAKVIADKLDGEQIYKVAFSIKVGEEKLTDPSTGKTALVKKNRNFIVCLSPGKNYRPLKIEEFLNSGERIELCTASNFREVASGIWLPYSLERRNSRNNQLLNIETISLNENAKVISKLSFPPGTYVKDKVAGIEYQVGLSDAYIDSSLKENMEKINLVRQDELILPDFNQEKQSADVDVNAASNKDVSTQNILLDTSSDSRTKRNIWYFVLSLFVISGFAVVLYHIHHKHRLR